jgi:Ca2+-binding EF-hand superfamily protein
VALGFGDYPGMLDEKQRRQVEEEVGDLIEEYDESQEGRVAATPVGKLLQERHEIAELLQGR